MKLAEWGPSSLPLEYSRFTSHVEHPINLFELRDGNFFRGAIDQAWIQLCMEIDKPMHKQLLQTLKQELRADPSGDHATYINNYRAKMEADSIYPFVASLRTQDQSLGEMNRNDRALYVTTFGSAKYPENMWTYKSFNDRLVNLGASNGILDYVNHLRLLNGARKLAVQGIYDIEKLVRDIHQGVSEVRGGTSKETMERLVRRAWEKSTPYANLNTRLFFEKLDREKGLFGEDAGIASSLWTTVIFPRTAQAGLTRYQKDTQLYPKIDDAIENLLNHNYPEAAAVIESILADFPTIFPEFVADRLGIRPDEVALRRQQVSERLQALADSERAARERARIDGLARLRETVLGFVGQTFTGEAGSLTIVRQVENPKHPWSFVVSVTGRLMPERVIHKVTKLNARTILRLIQERGLQVK